MYLHLGQNVMVGLPEVVGIFDMDTSTVRAATKDYLHNAEKEKRVVNVSTDLPKSFVVCKENTAKEHKFFISPLSTSTLSKRKEMRKFF